MIKQPITIKLGDQKDYTFHPMGGTFFMRLTEWLNEIEGKKPQEHRAVDDVISVCSTSAHGLVKIMQLSMSKSHPELTMDEVGDLMSFQKMTEVVGKIMDMPDGPDGDEKTVGK